MEHDDGRPPAGNVVGEVQGISDDGTTLLGNWGGDAYRYTEKGGVAGINRTSWTGIATDIANNGTIVGFDVLQQRRCAWIQPGGEGDSRSGSSITPARCPPMASSASARESLCGRSIIGHDFFTEDAADHAIRRHERRRRRQRDRSR